MFVSAFLSYLGAQGGHEVQSGDQGHEGDSLLESPHSQVELAL